MAPAASVAAATSSPSAKGDDKNTGWKMALAGALSGAASRTLVAPFDRVKLLAQVAAVPGSLSSSSTPSNPSAPYPSSPPSSAVIARAASKRSAAATLVAIYESEGPRGLFRGNVAALLRTIPYSAVQLSTYDLLKRSLAAKAGGAEGQTELGEASASTPGTRPSSPSPRLATGARLAAAAGAGVAAAAVSHPLDTLRLRFALPKAATSVAAAAASSLASPPSSLVATAASVVRNEGLFSLYRGLSAAVLGAAPFSAISLMTFDGLQSLSADGRRREWEEEMARRNGAAEPATESEVETAAATMTMQFLSPPPPPPSTACPPIPFPQPPPWEPALAGAVAGAVASTATYPIDTLRRRLQLPTSTSVAGCVGVVPSGEQVSSSSSSAALRSSHTRSLLSAAATAIRTDGFFSLYRGWAIGCGKLAPQLGIRFGLYGLLKRAMNVEHAETDS